MSAFTLKEMQQDNLVMSVARALALANEAALARGVEPAKAIVSITEDTSSPNRLWRIHYGRRDYVNRRGGDLTVFVDERGEAVQRILRGQ
jgi:citrate lyase beta subunit